MTALNLAGDVAVVAVFVYLVTVYGLVLNRWAPWNEVLCTCTPAERAAVYAVAKATARDTDEVQVVRCCELLGHHVRLALPPFTFRPLNPPTEEGA